MGKSGGWGRKQVRITPEGEVRQSQVVTTYGSGSMVDLIDHAILVGGLDFWHYNSSQNTYAIAEPRLYDALSQRFAAAGRDLSMESTFRTPPAGDSQDAQRNCGIRVLEFPSWFVCQNPQCRALARSHALELKGGRYRHHCHSKKSEQCVPVRFVGACKRGHIEDFHWVAYAHGKDGPCMSPQLHLEEGATGDFSEIIVRCACGAREALAGALASETMPYCHGHRPWLGSEGQEECTERIRLLVRTASNGYFSQVVSALSVPDKGSELQDAVRGAWEILKVADATTLATFRNIPKVQTAIGKYGDADVLKAIEAVKRDAKPERDPLRTAEYKQFMSSPAESPGDLPSFDDVFYVRQHQPKAGLPSNVSTIVLAHKLREVRAQIGFTRLEPATPDLEGEFDLEVQSAALGLTTNWLPAAEIRGEGIFVGFDEEAIYSWEQRPEVIERGLELLAGYDAWAETLSSAPAFPGMRFYLLHSLSHLLISAISLECGYAASAIRERIYCAAHDAKVPMAAILLSTGSSGTEGTLGGLVDQGRNLNEHLRRAYDLGRLCSSDPVCASHSPKDDHAERYLEGAACHGCLFIAECSCERFNRMLDRALVLPTMGRPPELAFFGERP